VPFEVASREVLRHNPLNAVTAVVERVRDARGATAVRKELRAPAPEGEDSHDPWAASPDPRHWNSWRREADAYRDDALRRSLAGTGLDMPAGRVVEHARGATLWLEDVAGTPGTSFALADHVAVAAGLGRWQAHGPLTAPWASRRFLRDYSASKRAPLHLVDDDAAWEQPLVRSTWPPALRQGWRRLLASRDHLLDVMEGLPRTRSHLDAWVSNEIRRPTGEVVLLDWAFAGDGAVGEDVGNHVPDAVLDLFWPAEDIGELDAACFEAHLAGLREAGWRGEDRLVRLGVVASCVKYTWLLPVMLQRATRSEQQAYHQAVDAQRLYSQRGLALTHLVAWCDEALRLTGVR
jgi:hypothetical protein